METPRSQRTAPGGFRQADGVWFRRANAMATGARTIRPTITQKKGRSMCVMSSMVMALSAAIIERSLDR